MKEMTKNQRKKLQRQKPPAPVLPIEEVSQGSLDKVVIDYALVCNELQVSLGMDNSINLFAIYSGVISKCSDMEYVRFLVSTLCSRNPLVFIHPNHWLSRGEDVYAIVKDIMTRFETYLELTPSMYAMLGSRITSGQVVDFYVVAQSFSAAADSIGNSMVKL